ncbi:MAG: holo-ACP synthase [Acidobacteriota bacterium]|nr:MAG: holo-ACP synthase [Acidobacteriota bacterium]
MILGVGLDVAEIDRIRQVIQRHGDRFLTRVLTEREREYCAQHRDPAPSVAARFAAKEALLKALGTGLSDGISWQDVEVVRQRGQAPKLELYRRAADLATARGLSRAHLSLSHDRGVAAAVVVLEA